MDKNVVRLRADLSKLRTDIDSAVKMVNRINTRGVTIPVSIRTSQRSINLASQQIRNAVQSAARHHTVSVGANVAPAIAAMGRVRQQARLTTAQRVEIRGHANFENVQAELLRVRRQVEAVNRMRVNVGGGGGAGQFFRNTAGRFTMGAAGGGAILGGAGASLGGGIGGAVGGLPGAIVGATAGKAVGTVGSAAAGMIGGGLQGLAQMESYKTTLSTILRDQTKANKLLAELNEMDMQLPVDLNLLASAATKLAGSGFEPEKLKGTVGAILNAASISTDGVAMGTERIVRAFSQIKSNGRLMGEELNQLTETGIPVRQIIQEQFGMNSQELAKKSQAGEIDIDTILNGILKGFEERFGGALEAQSMKLNGMVDTLADKARAFQREIAEPLFEPLQDSLKQLIEAIDAGKLDALIEAFKNLSGVIGDVLPKIVSWFETIAAGYDYASGNSAKTQANKKKIDAMRGDESTHTKSAADARKQGDIIAETNAAMRIASTHENITELEGRTSGNHTERQKARRGRQERLSAFYMQRSEEAFKSGDVESSGMLAVVANRFNKLLGNDEQLSPQRRQLKEEMDARQPEAVAARAAAAEAESHRPKKGDFVGPTWNNEPVDTSVMPIGTTRAEDIKGFVGPIKPKEITEKEAKIAADKVEDGKRFEKAVSDFPKEIKDFASSFKTDTERDAVMNSQYEIKQVKGEDGRMVPQYSLKKMAEDRGSVQNTDFSGLNSLVQSNLDANIAANQLKTQEKMAVWLEKINEGVRGVKESGKEAIVGSG